MKREICSKHYQQYNFKKSKINITFAESGVCKKYTEPLNIKFIEYIIILSHKIDTLSDTYLFSLVQKKHVVHQCEVKL